MGKIRVKTIGDEAFEAEQAEKDKKRREAKKAKKNLSSETLTKGGKAHVKGVGLKGGQQVSVMEGVELKPEIAALLKNEVKAEEKPVKVKKVKAKVRSKRYQLLRQLVDRTKFYPLKDALKLLVKTANTRFDATVETHININPATLPPDKPSLSGFVTLPHGTGKQRKIVIVTEEILQNIAAGKINFHVLVTHPQFMPKLAKFAKVLGPKGLMPNPKNGTITATPEKRAKELSGGEIQWKTEPDHPVIHQIIGKVSFGEDKIKENLTKLVKAVSLGKIAKITLSSSMGPGIKVDLQTL